MPPKQKPTIASHSDLKPVRRTSGQPKSSRQQFSACGACRMRRVRCDLKDLQRGAGGSTVSISCTNCQERSIKCVDEYVQVKAVKLLRRGRRLQQVEAVYGKTTDQDQVMRVPDNSISRSRSPPRSLIPILRPEFFTSPFYRRFQVQRPILDPAEFSNRYYDFYHGNRDSLGPPGQIIAKLLATWAASYGVDESGIEEPHQGPKELRPRRLKINEMVKEILFLIDLHGIMRKPTWDGVRALLLIMPLAEEAVSSMDRLSMYESALNQVYTLCSLASVSSVNSGQGEFVDALVRARIFWYAHVHEGVNHALRGGRLLLEDDDMTAFQTTLPAAPGNNQALTRSNLTYSLTYRYATVPIRVSAACRLVHSALTGPKARQRKEVNENKLKMAWEGFEKCWTEFEELKALGPIGISKAEDTERFVNGWQIFIFECHNIIREVLQQQANEYRNPRTINLYAIAETKCQEISKYVLQLIKQHLRTAFFPYDASLVRDGCFFAGFMAAKDEKGTEEELNICLEALGEMRWAFSKSEERMKSLRAVWGEQQVKRTSVSASIRKSSSDGSDSPLGSRSPPALPPPPAIISIAGFPLSNVIAHRQILPPLDLGGAVIVDPGSGSGSGPLSATLAADQHHWEHASTSSSSMIGSRRNSLAGSHHGSPPGINGHHSPHGHSSQHGHSPHNLTRHSPHGHDLAGHSPHDFTRHSPHDLSGHSELTRHSPHDLNHDLTRHQPTIVPQVHYPSAAPTTSYHPLHHHHPSTRPSPPQVLPAHPHPHMYSYHHQGTSTALGTFRTTSSGGDVGSFRAYEDEGFAATYEDSSVSFDATRTSPTSAAAVYGDRNSPTVGTAYDRSTLPTSPYLGVYATSPTTGGGTRSVDETFYRQSFQTPEFFNC